MPDIRPAIDLIQQTTHAALKPVMEDVMRLCDGNYDAAQMAMYLAHEEIALHALGNAMPTEDEFVRTARGESEEKLRERWLRQQAERAMRT